LIAASPCAGRRRPGPDHRGVGRAAQLVNHERLLRLALDLLGQDEQGLAHLRDLLEDGDPTLISAALGDDARSRGMSKVARKAGLGRESLYKALSAEGNSEFATVMKVIRSLGLRLQVHVG
jgi:probable addiction module antidote protein